MTMTTTCCMVEIKSEFPSKTTLHVFGGRGLVAPLCRVPVALFIATGDESA